MRQEKECYSYNPNTLLYQGVEYADKHPFLEEEWILPAHSTFSPPNPLTDTNKELLRYDPILNVWDVIKNPNYLEEMKSLRKIAYRENTDDLLMKILRLKLEGREEEVEDLEEKVKLLVREIKELYPYD